MRQCFSTAESAFDNEFSTSVEFQKLNVTRSATQCPVLTQQYAHLITSRGRQRRRRRTHRKSVEIEMEINYAKVSKKGTLKLNTVGKHATLFSDLRSTSSCQSQKRAAQRSRYCWTTMVHCRRSHRRQTSQLFPRTQGNEKRAVCVKSENSM